jgi:NitT/TauT family transport system permease protein
VVALAPLAAALIALAVDWFLPSVQEQLLTLDALPAWKHPYLILLYAISAASILAALLQTLWRSAQASVRHYAPLVAGATLLTGLWNLITAKVDWLPQPFFPTPDAVFAGLIEDRMLLLVSTLHSLRLLACGYLAGVAAGLASGVLIGWFPRVRYWGVPALKFIGPIPATALVPLVMMMPVKEFSFLSGAALIAFAVWFPVTTLTSSGIANVRLSHLDVARTFGASRLYLVFRVAIPSAMPHIFVGLFIGLGASFLTLIGAETVGVTAGLGWYVQMQKGYADYAKVYGSLIIMSIFFSAIMTLLFKFRDRVLKWQKGVIKW